MGGLVQGAAMGVAFQLLFNSVLDATHKVASFSSDLNRLTSTLCSIKPAIDDIVILNKILNRPPHETEAFTVRLIEGEKLIHKCSKVKYWNVFKIWYYSQKLSKLESQLLNFFQINVAAFHFLESKRTSLAVSNLEKKINEIVSIMMKSGEICGCNSNGLSEIDQKVEMVLEKGRDVVEMEIDADSML